MKPAEARTFLTDARARRASTFVHAYHVYADGAWEMPVAEHLAALEQAEFEGTFVLGIVGRLENRAAVLEVVGRSQFIDFTVQAEVGYEQLTLRRVHRWAIGHDGAILYAHTKGAAATEPFRDRWRRSMTARVITPWRENLELLADADAVGCHWLTDEKFPGSFGPPRVTDPQTVPIAGSGFFAGNFWLASCAYLRGLPCCPTESRWAAEAWIGTNHPQVVDLLPGWPHDRCWPELLDAAA